MNLSRSWGLTKCGIDNADNYVAMMQGDTSDPYVFPQTEHCQATKQVTTKLNIVLCIFFEKKKTRSNNFFSFKFKKQELTKMLLSPEIGINLACFAKTIS